MEQHDREAERDRSPVVEEQSLQQCLAEVESQEETTARFEEMTAALTKKTEELTIVQEQVREQERTITALVHHVGKLDRYLTNLLETKRWKLGERIVSAYRKVLGKPALPSPRVTQEHLREEFHLRLQARHQQSPSGTGVPLSQTGPPPVSILFLLPVRGGGGGAHSVVQEVQGMRQLGIRACIANDRRYQTDFTAQYPGIRDTEDLFYFYASVEELVGHAARFQVVIATVYHSVALLQKIIQSFPEILPGYYVQDYEPFFFADSSKERERAVQSYTLVPDTVLFAKTQWLCDLVEKTHDVKVEKVTPSLDRTVYTSLPATAPRSGPVRVVSMIRPTTPRRGAERTMRVLQRLKTVLHEQIHIDLFGCASSDPEFQLLAHDFAFHQHGVLTREGVADLLRQADIFLDFSDYQAFGRTGLEAMACGCAVVVPREGGVHEYAVDRENALVIDTASEDHCYAAVAELVGDSELRRKLARQALVTASAYSIEKSARSEVAMLQERWRARHARSARPVLPAPRQDRPQVSSRLRILGLLPVRDSGEFPASAYIRVILPLRHPALREHLQFSPVTETQAWTARGDILVVQRTALGDLDGTQRLLAHCRKHNIRLVYELDDNLFAMSEHHQVGAYRRAMQSVLAFLPQADFVIVASENLKAKVQAFNRNVRVLPNALDERLWATPLTSRFPTDPDAAPTRILYMGSRTHTNDLLVIKEAIQRLTEEYGERVVLDVVGGVPEGEEEPWFRACALPPRARGSYPDFVAWLRTAAPWRIGVIPLADTEFNRGKSYIKYLDYAALGLAVLCSDVEPYHGVVRHEENGLFVENSPAAWYHALTRVITDPSLRATLGQAAYEDVVRDHTLKTQAHHWLETYRQALSVKSIQES